MSRRRGRRKNSYLRGERRRRKRKYVTWILRTVNQDGDEEEEEEKKKMKKKKRRRKEEEQEKRRTRRTRTRRTRSVWRRRRRRRRRSGWSSNVQHTGLRLTFGFARGTGRVNDVSQVVHVNGRRDQLRGHHLGQVIRPPFLQHHRFQLVWNTTSIVRNSVSADISLCWPLSGFLLPLAFFFFFFF